MDGKKTDLEENNPSDTLLLTQLFPVDLWTEL